MFSRILFGRSGPEASTVLTDEQIARQLYEQEVADEVLARRLARDGTPAGDVDHAGADEGLALRLMFDDPESVDLNLYGSGHAHDADADADAVDEEDPMTEDAELVAGEARVWAVCAACREREMCLRLSCGDAYCADCLSHLFRSAMTDEALFPPRCHTTNIPLKDAGHMLGPELTEEFRAKAVELSTVDRTYCHQPRCATFVPPDTIRNDVAVCPNCGSGTCAICKAANHGGDCPRDEGLQQLLATAAGQGRRRCDNCRRVIELNYGCNHMTQVTETTYPLTTSLTFWQMPLRP